MRPLFGNRPQLAAVILSALPALAQSGFSPPLPESYSITPWTTTGTGNSARRDRGGFLSDPSAGFEHLIYWIGTDNTPGTLNLEFNTPFTDGLGYDFALTTSTESWGPLAQTLSVDFYLGAMFVGSIPMASPIAGATLEFELPGDGMIVDRVLITNTSADPSGVNDLATLAFTNAGGAFSTAVPEPASFASWFALAAGFAAVLHRRGLVRGA